MGLETGTYISDLVSTNPAFGDVVSQGDDHIRLIKATVKATFPNLAGAVTPTHTELNYVDGVTSAIQPQLDAHTAADLTKLPLAGGTMTGDITLAGDPDAALKPATKQYADAADALALPKAGGTMTGDLVLAGEPDSDLKAATKKYVDDAGAALEASFGQSRVLAAGVFIGSSAYWGAIPYARTGTTVVCTYADHPYLVGSILHIAIATDAGLISTSTVVTAITGTTFTFETASTGTSSGTLTIQCALIKGINITNVECLTNYYIFKFTFDVPPSDNNYIIVTDGYYARGSSYADVLYHDRSSGAGTGHSVKKRDDNYFVIDAYNHVGSANECDFVVVKW